MDNDIRIRFLREQRPEPCPRCEAMRVTRYYRDCRTSDYQCKHAASVIMEGRALCMRHAGNRALQIVKAQQKCALTEDGYQFALKWVSDMMDAVAPADKESSDRLHTLVKLVEFYECFLVSEIIDGR